MFDLTGKKAMVTGSTRGLGRAMAEGLMEQGAEVCLFGTTDRVFEVAAEYEGRGFHCHGVVTDLSDREDRRRAFDEALMLLGGRVDILLNAAGMINRYPDLDYTPEKVEKILGLNVVASYDLCTLAGPLMAAQGYGRIINVASVLAFFGGLHVPDYAASKGAIKQMTMAFCNEWGGSGVTCNAIAPGYYVTDLNAALLADEVRKAGITARIPAGRWGDPSELKAAAVFLASDEAGYVNGITLTVDGGYCAK